MTEMRSSRVVTITINGGSADTDELIAELQQAKEVVGKSTCTFSRYEGDMREPSYSKITVTSA